MCHFLPLTCSFTNWNSGQCLYRQMVTQTNLCPLKFFEQKCFIDASQGKDRFDKVMFGRNKLGLIIFKLFDLPQH